MKKHFLLAGGLALSAALTGCGGSSSDGASVQEYSLTEYEGRTVSADTLAGTWVAVGTGNSSSDFASANYAIKEYFVIRETQDGYEKARCEHGFKELQVSGDQISIEHDYNYDTTEYDRLTGSVNGNVTITATLSAGDTDPDFLYSNDSQVVAVKISDSVSALGSVAVNSDDTSVDSLDVYCMQTINGNATVTGIGTSNVETRDFGGESGNALILEEVTGSSPRVWVYIAEQLDFDTADEDSASFEISEESGSTISAVFSGSDDAEAGSGSVQVQLPLQ